MAKMRSNSEIDRKEVVATLSALRVDLEALRKDVEALSDTIEASKTLRLKDSIDAALITLHETKAYVEHWGEDQIESLRESIRKQPLASCAKAMGIGALIGCLFLRR